jgi:imidazole glycerol phosphate synthase subunit HisF
MTIDVWIGDFMHFCLCFDVKNWLLKFVKAFLDIPCIKYGTAGVRTHFHSAFMKEKIVDAPIFGKNFPENELYWNNEVNDFYTTLFNQPLYDACKAHT